MDKQKEAEEMQEEMISIVKSDEAKSVFEEGLKKLDPKALTAEGVIQTYEIDYDSIKHNPMGGINVTLVINEDSSQDIEFNIDKRNDDFVVDGADLSGKISKILKEKGDE